MKASLDGEWVGSGRFGTRSDEESFTDIGDEPVLAAPALDLERGSVLGGRYQVEAVIGKGGSGVVLRAFDRIAQEAVAVKILKAELAADPHWIERFSRELRLARQIQHPNVCRVFDISEADGHKFLTMELASGGTLRTAVRPDSPPRPLAERITDARALVDGMAAIHAAGIMHRDIKPDNMLRMNDGRLVVSDFGLATNPTQVPSVTVMVGTPSYMAPEIVMGDPASLRSDVWAIGIVLHEILFNKRPEWDVTPRGRRYISAVGKKAPPMLRALADLCGKCAAENPTVRPADAVAVARLFQQAQQGLPASASRPRSRQTRRSWLWAGTAALAVLALFATQGRWRTSAVASVRPEKWGHRGVLEPLGQSADWRSSTSEIAMLSGRVHCVAAIGNGKTLRVIWGLPRRAEDIDVLTRKRAPSPIRTETFADGCPETSPDGRSLLFERYDSLGRRQIVLSQSPDGGSAEPLILGSNPIWMPSGKEFLFTADESHAAIFSLPTMSSALISETLAGPRQIEGAAVSPDGSVVAVYYMDELLRKTVVVHRLPSLEIVATETFPKNARDFSFKDAKSLSFSYDEPTGDASLVSYDWSTRTANRLGRIPGEDLRNMGLQRGQLAFVSRSIGSDVWRYDPGVAPTQVTRGDEDYNPDMSVFGDLLVENRLPNGDEVIRLYETSGKTWNVSLGPQDHSPSFLPSGKGFLFVKGDQKTIMRCDRLDRESCQPIYESQDLPLFPVASPDGHNVLFVIGVGRPRLFLLNDSGTKDLGPARMDCAPRWSSNQTAWVLEGPDSRPEWAEVATASGERTGNITSAGARGPTRWGCPFSVFPPRTPSTTPVLGVPWEQSEVRIRN
jgi:serine/threonine-protein kinase